MGWSGPFRKHGYSKKSIGSWGQRSEQDSGFRWQKACSFAKDFLRLLLCNSLPPPNLPISEELILFKVNCLRNYTLPVSWLHNSSCYIWGFLSLALLLTPKIICPS